MAQVVWIVGYPEGRKRSDDKSRTRLRLPQPPWLAQRCDRAGVVASQSGEQPLFQTTCLARIQPGRTYEDALTEFCQEEELLFNYYARRRDFMSLKVLDTCLLAGAHRPSVCISLAARREQQQRISRSGNQVRMTIKNCCSYPVDDWLQSDELLKNWLRGHGCNSDGSDIMMLQCPLLVAQLVAAGRGCRGFDHVVALGSWFKMPAGDPEKRSVPPLLPIAGWPGVEFWQQLSKDQVPLAAQTVDFQPGMLRSLAIDLKRLGNALRPRDADGGDGMGDVESVAATVSVLEALASSLDPSSADVRAWKSMHIFRRCKGLSRVGCAATNRTACLSSSITQ